MLELLLQINKPSGSIPTGPGPQEIIVGDDVDGYYGTLNSAEFFTPTELASLCGVQDSGFAINETTRWHKVIIDKKVLYHPFLPIRWGLPQAFLDSYGLVRGDATAKRITKGGKTYIVRLMSGVNPGVTPVEGNVPDNCEKSEYNRIIYRLTNAVPVDGLPNKFNTWSLDELGISRGFTAGCYICKESLNGNAVIRNGDNGIQSTNQWTALVFRSATTQNSQNGWRPVLELVG